MDLLATLRIALRALHASARQPVSRMLA